MPARHRPPAGIPRCARGARPAPRAPMRTATHSETAERRRCGASSTTSSAPTRSSWRATSWPAERCRCSRARASGCPRTSRSSASTTRRSRRRSTPQLTTMRQPSLAQGERMASVLLDLLAGRHPRHVTILETELVVRDSVSSSPHGRRPRVVERGERDETPPAGGRRQAAADATSRLFHGSSKLSARPSSRTSKPWWRRRSASSPSASGVGKR